MDEAVEDTLISHDNSEEIKAAIAAKKNAAEAVAQPNADFSIGG